MLNSATKEEQEERPFTREIYNYLHKVENKKLKEMWKTESGHVFVAKCKTKFLSQPKRGYVKMFNEKIRECLRKSKVNKIEDDSFGMNTVYEIKNEDLNQSILVESNLNENFVKSNNEENLINDLLFCNGMDDIVNTTYQMNTYENINHFVRLLGPYPDEPIFAALDKILCFMLPFLIQDHQ